MPTKYTPYLFVPTAMSEALNKAGVTEYKSCTKQPKFKASPARKTA